MTKQGPKSRLSHYDPNQSDFCSVCSIKAFMIFGSSSMQYRPPQIHLLTHCGSSHGGMSTKSMTLPVLSFPVTPCGGVTLTSLFFLTGNGVGKAIIRISFRSALRDLIVNARRSC